MTPNEKKLRNDLDFLRDGGIDACIDWPLVYKGLKTLGVRSGGGLGAADFRDAALVHAAGMPVIKVNNRAAHVGEYGSPNRFRCDALD